MHALTDDEREACAGDYADVKQAIRFVTRGNEDAESLADEIYLYSWASYREAMGASLSTWVSFRLTRAMLAERRKQARRNKLLPRAAIDPDLLPTSTGELTFSFNDFLERLGEDAKYVVLLVLFGPGKFTLFDQAYNGHEAAAAQVRGKITELLMELGWAKRRVRLAFAEIRRSLYTGA